MTVRGHQSAHRHSSIGREIKGNGNRWLLPTLAIAALSCVLFVVWLALNPNSTILKDWKERAGHWWGSAGQLVSTDDGIESGAGALRDVDVLSAPALTEAETPAPTEVEDTSEEEFEEEFEVSVQAEPSIEIGAPVEFEVEADLPEDAFIAAVDVSEIMQEVEQAPVLRVENFQVEFGFDSASLTAEARELLNDVADLASRSKVRRLVVAGYSDNVGDDGYNLALSHRRAEAVAQYLLERKVDASYLVVEGLGPGGADGEPLEKVRIDDKEPASRRVAELELELELDGYGGDEVVGEATAGIVR